jgi:hypothetical protein
MELTLGELRDECDRAARELLSIHGWPCPKSKVEAAVAEIRGGTRLATSSMNWLLHQIPKIPADQQPANRVNDLIQALRAVREHRDQGALREVTATR